MICCHSHRVIAQQVLREGKENSYQARPILIRIKQIPLFVMTLERNTSVDCQWPLNAPKFINVCYSFRISRSTLKLVVSKLNVDVFFKLEGKMQVSASRNRFVKFEWLSILYILVGQNVIKHSNAFFRGEWSFESRNELLLLRSISVVIFSRFFPIGVERYQFQRINETLIESDWNMTYTFE